MAFNIKCTRCEELHSAKNEHESEIWFTQHECKNMRNLDDMPFEILTELVHNRIDETEAWRRVDATAK